MHLSMQLCTLNLFSKSDHKILSYGHFKMKAKEYSQWGEGIDPKHFISLLYISVAIKASLLKFSIFNIHKYAISDMLLVFSNFKTAD